MSSPDVVVVGDGVLGLSLALALTRAGSRVVVVRGGPSFPAASRAAGAMLGCFGEVTASGWASPLGRTKVQLALLARQAWPAWLAALDEDLGDPTSLRTAEGTVVLLNAAGLESIDSANYAAVRAGADELGEPYEDVDPAEPDWLDADANARPLRAMLLPREDAVDAGRLLGALERGLVARGGALRAGPATALICDGDQVRGACCVRRDGASVVSGGSAGQMACASSVNAVARRSGGEASVARS